ncbi:putative SLACS reverse transcriptase [Trypanosoma cruzi]|uniref:Putative SLACS reverse transcriptase n=1 Tax=Trypanosoma cruzi TaxID=5693 RepID=A0A2V2UFK0_TRYCR|nr:putative SLACS reverse transcriptase [Trypanosoma cruzi]
MQNTRATFTKPCRVLIAKVFVSNTAAGAGRPLTDPQVHADDRGFSTYLRERLLVRVLPEGQKCVCGADASNEHVHTCTRLQQNPRTTRHDMINMTFANGLRLCGFQCGMEPRLTEASRRRPDILIVGLDTYAITDVTVTYAGRVTAYVSEESMEEADPLRAARDRLTQKRQKYRHWALANGLDFEPFVMLTNGAIHPASRRWLRRILGNQDHRLTITNAYDMIVGGHPGGHAAWKRARLQRSVRPRGDGVIPPRVGECPGDPRVAERQ